MKRDTYSLVIKIIDPEDSEHHAEVKFDNCSREQLLSVPVISNVLISFELMTEGEG